MWSSWRSPHSSLLAAPGYTGCHYSEAVYPVPLAGSSRGLPVSLLCWISYPIPHILLILGEEFIQFSFRRNGM